MKILKRLIMVFLLLSAGMSLVLPAAIWWVLTGKDFLSPIMDGIVLKYWVDE